MDDFDDLDLPDLDDEGGLDLADVEAPADVAIDPGGRYALDDPPDPVTTSDVPAVTFGAYDGSVTFDDGTTVDNPHQDALGNVYKSHDEWVGGVNKYTPNENGTADPA